MLKAESGYLESGAPEKAGPYPEEQSKSGKRKREKTCRIRRIQKLQERKNKRQRKNEKERRREKQREEAELRVKNVGEMLAKLYDPDSDSVAMNTSKTVKFFRMHRQKCGSFLCLMTGNVRNFKNRRPYIR